MLRNCKLKHTYQSPEDNIVQDFYEVVLKKATQYDRVSGYFSSSVFEAYSTGLDAFINNAGKMRLIISKEISLQDYDAIKYGYDMKDIKFEDIISEDLPEITSFKELSHYNKVSFMIANNQLDIKVGFVHEGLFHTKFGLISDEQDTILFNGSHNETFSGVVKNYEMFNVTPTWLSSDFEKKRIEYAQKEFEDLWSEENTKEMVFVESFNQLVMEEILEKGSGEKILRLKRGDDMANIVRLRCDEKGFFIDESQSEKKIDTQSFEYVFNVEKYFVDLGFPRLNDDISYIEVNRFIVDIDEYCKSISVLFVVDEKVQEWIDKQNYRIEQRKYYGNLIKSKDESLSRKIFEFKNILDEEMTRVLREQQLWAAFFMTEMEKTANFSVPGSGKTSMTFGSFAYLNSPTVNKVDRIVMIGPKNSFESWKSEFIANFGPKKDMNVLDIHQFKGDIHNELLLNISNYNLILFNYESLSGYVDVLKRVLDNRTMLVYDEVHRIKNPEGKYAEAGLDISHKCYYKHVLTGTPIPNSYKDIYNFLNILYTSEYEEFFGWDSNELQQSSNSPRQRDEINRKMYPFYWRTNKNELSVPKANEDNIIKVMTTNEEQNIIDMLYRKYHSEPLVLYMRLMQVSSNPSLLENDDDLDVSIFEGFAQNPSTNIFNSNKKFTKEELDLIKKVDKSGKYLKAIRDTIELVNKGHKVIVWCIFRGTINSLKEDLETKGIKVAAIFGDTEYDTREDLISGFKYGEIDVLITNPHTLGESVSLHENCHHALYLEYSFNLTHMLQSRDRIHRLGLKETQETNYYYYMLEGNPYNTIDERIYQRLKEKESIMFAAVEGDYLEPMPEDQTEEIISLFEE